MQLEKAGKKSIFKKTWFWIVAVVLVVFIVFLGSEDGSNGDLQGSKYDSNIEMVKSGSPNLIPNITYEQAYGNFFGNPQWRGFTADTGEHVVEFSGECTYYNEEAQVYIQFIIEDSNTFSMYYAHMNIGGEKVTLDGQTFIELVYTPFATYSEEVLGKSLDDDIEDAFREFYNNY